MRFRSMRRAMIGGFVANPTPVTPQSVNSLNYLTNNVQSATAGAVRQFGTYTGSTLAELGIQAGTLFASTVTASLLRSISRLEVTSNVAGGQFSFGTATVSATPGTAFTQTPFVVGDSAVGPNHGGFYLELYCGIGENYASGFNPFLFIGLSTGINAVPNVGGNTIYTAGAANTLGIICNTTVGGGIPNWAWVTQRGTGAPQITTLGIAPAAQQLFALKFDAPAGSDAIKLSVSLLTSLGVWTPLLTAQSVAGIGPAGSIRLSPGVFGQNNYAGAGTNGVMLHRVFGIADQYTVGKAFQ